MDRAKLAVLKYKMGRVVMWKGDGVLWEKWLRDKIVEILEALLEEPKPTATEYRETISQSFQIPYPHSVNFTYHFNGLIKEIKRQIKNV